MIPRKEPPPYCGPAMIHSGGNASLIVLVLTYMSIRDEINRHLVSGDLVRILPSLASIPIRRTVVLSSEINNLLNGPWLSVEAADGFGRLKNDIDAFIAGNISTVATHPHRAKTAFLNRLADERGQIWEMRQRRPIPGIRVIGGFSEPDIFIGLTWHPRVLLNGYGSREWRDAIEECKAMWRQLFLSWPPYGNEKASINDYVSNILPI
jgi:hypothetical protein